MRVYYHPAVGEYASYPSFEVGYGLVGGSICGLLLSGLKRDFKLGLLGAGVGFLIGGYLVPKRILSWYDPPPFDPPLKYPKEIPKTVVPSFIGEQGQVLNLLMYEGAGDVVKDYSPHGNHGKIYGANWVDGHWGWALSFDGIDDYVEIPHSPSQNVKRFTIILWLYPREWKYTALIMKSADDWVKNFNFGVWLGTEATVLYGHGDGTTFFWKKAPANILSLNTWNHIALTYDGLNYILYVNGTVKDTATTSIVPLESSANILLMSNVKKHTVNGMIGTVYIYNRALTEREIRYHYESTKVIYE